MEKAGGEGWMAGVEVDGAVQGEVVRVESGSEASQQEICLLMNVQGSVEKGERLSECLLVNGLGRGFQIVDIHLCWTCRACRSQEWWMTAGPPGGSSSVREHAGLCIGCWS